MRALPALFVLVVACNQDHAAGAAPTQPVPPTVPGPPRSSAAPQTETVQSPEPAFTLEAVLDLARDQKRLGSLTPANVTQELRALAPRLKDDGDNGISRVFTEKNEQGFIRRVEVVFADPKWPFDELSVDVRPEDRRAAMGQARDYLTRALKRKPKWFQPKSGALEHFGWWLAGGWELVVHTKKDDLVKVMLHRPEGNAD